MPEEAVVMYTCRFCGAMHPNASDVERGYCVACKDEFDAAMARLVGAAPSEAPAPWSLGDIFDIAWKVLIFGLIAGFIVVQFLYP